MREVLDRLNRAHQTIVNAQQLLQANGFPAFAVAIYLALNPVVDTLEYVLEQIRDKEEETCEKSAGN